MKTSISKIAIIAVTVIAISCIKRSHDIEKITKDNILTEELDKKIPIPKIDISVHCDIARPKFDCESGTWLCDCYVDVNVDIFGNISGGNNGNNPKNKERLAFLDLAIEEQNSQKQIVINFKEEDNIVKGEDFFFSEAGEDFVMPKEISSRLGYRELVLKSGKYPIDYSRNPNGSVIIELAKAVK
ncbi:MAG: hypothetical protein ACLGGV_00555 [Bacteroidia bacterium]